MRTRIFFLGGDDAELDAALPLSRVGHVCVQVSRDSPKKQRLMEAGFFYVPESVECIVSLPIEIRTRSRGWRRNLKKSMDSWKKEGLCLRLYTVASYGLDNLISRLYFPIFVPEFYAKGISPYGAHNLEAFRHIATADVLVAVVEQHRTVVGGGLLRRSGIQDRNSILIKGERLEGESVEGLIYVLAEGFGDCRRAFLYHLTEALFSFGFRRLSLGRDLVWIDAGYLPILVEKIRWADEVSANFGTTDSLFSIQTAQVDPQHGAMVFSLEDGDVLVRVYKGRGSSTATQLFKLIPSCRFMETLVN